MPTNEAMRAAVKLLYDAIQEERCDCTWIDAWHEDDLRGDEDLFRQGLTVDGDICLGDIVARLHLPALLAVAEAARGLCDTLIDEADYSPDVMELVVRLSAALDKLPNEEARRAD